MVNISFAQTPGDQPISRQYTLIINSNTIIHFKHYTIAYTTLGNVFTYHQ